MKVLFKSPLRSYVLGFFLLTFITGGVIYQTNPDLILLISVLLAELIVSTLLLMQLYDKYIRPLDKAVETIDELVKGNFRARVHQRASGKMSDLSNKINVLARNLSELSIHEKIQAEQLSTIVNNTESGIVLIDEKGYIHYVNRMFIDMFGKSSKDYHGYLYYDVLEKEEIHKTVQETFLYETNVRSTFKKITAGKLYHLQIVGAPIFDERGRLKGAVLVIYDITELKKIELMRKDFVANVSHELKTPITSIKGFAETLLDGAMEDVEMREQFLKIIYDESDRMQFLIDDLLTLSRLENDGFYLELTSGNASELASDIEPLIRQKANKKQIQFTTNIDDEVIATLDREKMKQVLINLLDNAISYTPEQGAVALRITNEEDQLLIEVKDTGIGIAEEAIPRLFERFYRIDKARSRDTGGTGLGLAIVKHIVELHHGRIEIKSKPNEGSTFKVYIPLKEHA